MVGLGDSSNQRSPSTAVHDALKAGAAWALLAFSGHSLEADPPLPSPGAESAIVSALGNEISSLRFASLPAIETQTRQRPNFPVMLAGGGPLPKMASEIFGRWSNQENVLIIAWASEIPDTYFEETGKQLKELGVKRVTRMPDVDVAIEAMARSEKTGSFDEQDPRRLLEEASGVWFTGGKQARAYFRLVQADMLQPIQEWVSSNKGPVGGTSAGCAIMSGIMIGGSGAAHEKELFGQVPKQHALAWTMGGLGAIDDMITDQHFDKRNREARLRDVLENAPSTIHWGIGVDESAVATISDKRYIDVFGPGGITLIRRYADGSLSESIRVVPGQRFDKQTGSLIPMGTVPENAEHFETLALKHSSN